MMKSKVLTTLLVVSVISMSFADKPGKVTKKSKDSVVTTIPSSDGITKDDKVIW